MMNNYLFDMDNFAKSFRKFPTETDCSYRTVEKINPKVFHVMSLIDTYDKNQDLKKLKKIMRAQKKEDLPDISIDDVMDLLTKCELMDGIHSKDYNPPNKHRIVGMKRVGQKRRVL